MAPPLERIGLPAVGVGLVEVAPVAAAHEREAVPEELLGRADDGRGGQLIVQPVGVGGQRFAVFAGDGEHLVEPAVGVVAVALADEAALRVVLPCQGDLVEGRPGDRQACRCRRGGIRLRQADSQTECSHKQKTALRHPSQAVDSK